MKRLPEIVLLLEELRGDRGLQGTGDASAREQQGRFVVHESARRDDDVDDLNRVEGRRVLVAGGSRRLGESLAGRAKRVGGLRQRLVDRPASARRLPVLQR